MHHDVSQPMNTRPRDLFGKEVLQAAWACILAARIV